MRRTDVPRRALVSLSCTPIRRCGCDRGPAGPHRALQVAPAASCALVVGRTPGWEGKARGQRRLRTTCKISTGRGAKERTTLHNGQRDTHSPRALQCFPGRGQGASPLSCGKEGIAARRPRPARAGRVSCSALICLWPVNVPPREWPRGHGIFRIRPTVALARRLPTPRRPSSAGRWALRAARVAAVGGE